MNNYELEWKPVKDSFSGNVIGALAVVDGTVSGVASFIDDRDGNNNGEVTNGEKFAAFISFIRLNGRATAYVANQAYADPDLLIEHPELYNIRGQLTAEFGARAVMDGIYAAYFKRPVNKIGTGIASNLTSSTVKSFAIRKSFETTVKKAFEKSVE